MYNWTVTKVNKFMDRWTIELDNGNVKVSCKYAPPYKVGDIIVELAVFYHFVHNLNYTPHFEWEKKQRQHITYY